VWERRGGSGAVGDGGVEVVMFPLQGSLFFALKQRWLGAGGGDGSARVSQIEVMNVRQHRCLFVAVDVSRGGDEGRGVELRVIEETQRIQDLGGTSTMLHFDFCCRATMKCAAQHSQTG